MRLYPSLGLLLMLGLSSCITGSDNPHGDDKPYSPRYHHHHNIPKISWGKGKFAKSYRNFFVSGPPREQSLLYARASKIEELIDLRKKSTKTESLKEKCEKTGINYSQIEIDDDKIFTRQNLDLFSNKVTNEADRFYLVVDGTPDKAAAMVAAYISDQSSLNTYMTLDIARSLGMKNKAVESQLEIFAEKGVSP